jgi:recombination protein RecT
VNENLPAVLSALQSKLVTADNARAVGKLWPGLSGDAADKQGARGLRLALLSMANPKAAKLRECTPDSILHAIKESAELGLEIGGSRQQAALVPYAGVCQFQPMYRGLIELAMRSGAILNVEAGIIYEGDWIEYSRGFPPKFEHIPFLFRRDAMKPKERGDTILCAYALFWLKDAPMVNGCSMPKIEVVEKWELDRIRDRSKNRSDDSPWKNWEEEMMKKTAIKRGCKTLRLSTELATAIEKDNEIEGAIDTDFTVLPEKTPDALAPGRHTLPKKGVKLPEAEKPNPEQAEKELHAKALAAIETIKANLADETVTVKVFAAACACLEIPYNDTNPDGWQAANDEVILKLLHELLLDQR